MLVAPLLDVLLANGARSLIAGWARSHDDTYNGGIPGADIFSVYYRVGGATHVSLHLKKHYEQRFVLSSISTPPSLPSLDSNFFYVLYVDYTYIQSELAHAKRLSFLSFRIFRGYE